MKIPKDVRSLGATITFCALIFASVMLYQRKVEGDRQKLVAAQKYVSQIRVGTFASSIESWIKANNFTFVREENNGINPFVYSMLVEAKLSSKKVRFYLMVWDKNERHYFDSPRHEFIFFFDNKKCLVKAVTWRHYARSVSF